MEIGVEASVASLTGRGLRRDPAVAAVRCAGWLRERGPALAAFALLLVTIESIRVWSSGGGSGGGDSLPWRAHWLAIELSTLGAGAVAGPVLAERAGWQGWRHLALTAASTFGAVGIGAAIVHGLFAADLELAARQAGFASGDALLARGWWFFTMGGLLFGSFAGSRDRVLAAIRAAQATELECNRIQRTSIDLQLQALEAQLEPPLLFGVLDEIESLYGTDPQAAERLQDDLIAYLRAALPRTPARSCTLADEAALVEACLRILPQARTRRVGVDIRLPEPLGRHPFPPMVLLPLARDAVAAQATAILVIGAPGRRPGGTPMVEVTMVAVGVARVPGWTPQRVAALQRTLTDLFGTVAALEIKPLAKGAAAVLTCPAAGSPDTEISGGRGQSRDLGVRAAIRAPTLGVRSTGRFLINSGSEQ
ncbi:MAG: histidine kinase [Betaproteobacteria bacterium]|nr:histidine kinase [Betaproteobacteria bacterium]